MTLPKFEKKKSVLGVKKKIQLKACKSNVRTKNWCGVPSLDYSSPIPKTISKSLYNSRVY